MHFRSVSKFFAGQKNNTYKSKNYLQIGKQFKEIFINAYAKKTLIMNLNTKRWQLWKK